MKKELQVLAYNSLFFLVGRARIELATFGLRVLKSIYTHGLTNLNNPLLKAIIRIVWR